MSSYAGRYAELYDLFYSDKPYQEEARFVHRCLHQWSDGPVRRLLELACGTGSHALALGKLGYEIVATDNSPDMLARARSKAEKASSRIDFRWQDMRDLDLPDRPFDAAISLFDSIGYTVTNEDLVRTLRGVHRYLRPGGLFVFEFWNAAAMLSYFEPERIRRWPVPGGEVVRLSETTLDREQRLARVRYTIIDLRADGTYSSYEETHVNRYFSPREMADWLSSCGFAPVKWFAGFTEDENISDATWHIVGVARRSAAEAAG